MDRGNDHVVEERPHSDAMSPRRHVGIAVLPAKYVHAITLSIRSFAQGVSTQIGGSRCRVVVQCKPKLTKKALISRTFIIWA
jgi:hypothetical protein